MLRVRRIRWILRLRGTGNRDRCRIHASLAVEVCGLYSVCRLVPSARLAGNAYTQRC